MTDATADQLRVELRAALDANSSHLRDALLAELARELTLEPGQRMQFEVDPLFYDITSCASEEPVLTDWLDGSLPANWYQRAEETLGSWDTLVSDELCPWFAECWQQVGGPQHHSPAFLFFHGYHNSQYDLNGRRWLSGNEIWGGPNA